MRTKGNALLTILPVLAVTAGAALLTVLDCPAYTESTVKSSGEITSSAANPDSKDKGSDPRSQAYCDRPQVSTRDSSRVKNEIERIVAPADWKCKPNTRFRLGTGLTAAESEIRLLSPLCHEDSARAVLYRPAKDKFRVFNPVYRPGVDKFEIRDLLYWPTRDKSVTRDLSGPARRVGYLMVDLARKHVRSIDASGTGQNSTSRAP